MQEVTGSSPVPSTIQFVLEPDSLRKRVRVRFLFARGSEKGLLGTVNRNEQRQGIIVAMVSCLLFCGIKFALCELGRPYMAHWRQSLRTCVPGACTSPARCNTLDFLPKSVCQEGLRPFGIPAARVRTYAEKRQNFTISGYSFLGRCDILGLVQQIGVWLVNRALYEYKNTPHSVFILLQGVFTNRFAYK